MRAIDAQMGWRALLRPAQMVDMHAHAHAPTYVDFVWSPAGLTGIGTIKLLLDFGASPGKMKLPAMEAQPRVFFWPVDAPETSSAHVSFAPLSQIGLV